MVPSVVVFESLCPNDMKKFGLEIHLKCRLDVCVIEQMMPSAGVVPPPCIRGILNFRQSQTIII